MFGEYFKPKVIEGDGGKPSYESRRNDLRDLERGYAIDLEDFEEGGKEKKPRWCVYGKDVYGNRGVIYWIRPVSNDELVAHQMAYLVTHTGGSAKAEMTEWHEDIKGEPVYAMKHFTPPHRGDEPRAGA